MCDLGGADAEGVGAESAVRGRMTVTAYDQQTRQGQSLFWTDDMNDALARIAQSEKADGMLGRVGLELVDHGGD